jgi:hypothetical protein
MKSPLDLVQKEARDAYIQRSTASFNKVVRLIRTSDKNLFPYGDMSLEENALFYVNKPKSHITPWKGYEGSARDNNGLVHGIVFIRHGREIYSQFDTHVVEFSEHSKSDFIALEVPRHIFEAVVKPENRQAIDSYVTSVAETFVGAFAKVTDIGEYAEKMHNLFHGAEPTTQEQLLKQLNSDINTRLDVNINYVFPNIWAFEEYFVSKTPHVVVNTKKAPGGLDLPGAINCSMLLPITQNEMMNSLTDISDRLLNPKNIVSDGKLPLQKALFDYIWLK